MKSSKDTGASVLPAALRVALKKGLVGAALFSGVINLLALIGPLFMLEVYDRVIPSRSLPTLVALGLLVAGAYLVFAVLDIIRSRVMSRIAGMVDGALSTQVFRIIAGTPLKIALDQDPLKPAQELEQIRAFIAGPGLMAFFDLPWMPVYLAVSFYIHPSLGWLALGMIVLMVLLTWLTDRGTRQAMRDSAALASQRNRLGQQAHGGAEVLAAMGMTERAADRWQALQEQYATLQRRSADVGSFYGGITKALRQLVQSASLGVGAWLVIGGDLSGGAIVAASIIVARTLAPAEQIIGTWRSLVSARLAWQQLRGVLAIFPPSAHRTALPGARSQVQVSGLCVAPPGVQRLVLQGVNFSLVAGSSLAVIGPSASGKSSLARALVGAWPALRGQVCLDGAALELWPDAARAAMTGYLPQSVDLFEASVGQNIARLDPQADAAAIVAAACQAGVHELILQLPQGYDTPVGEGGVNLSAGQRQRIGLARALYGEPFLVVLDEPNANLDAEGERALARAIEGVKARGGVVVAIAHRSGLLAVMDQVLVLEQGAQAAFGPRDTVLARPVALAEPRVAKGGVQA
ncbi:type I secretion system permease/ATPase [Pseudomonas sp. BW13M1]|uniref:Type I secretion system permease/ATPase n=1 Tax=Pseudomonas peradeniyensis TaxID=2745488 RepID=A0A923GD41_9PSED|nr:type I secretion system permease/ATPase [Pseudomonas peradeniyensis]MBV4508113.1 type I secretion system permease/ATPase [Pseudomonas peradeniyensis]